MNVGFLYWVKSLAILAVLGAALGGMGSYWYFFWENREMCPCAPAGLEGGENIKVVQPYSDELMKKRVAAFSFAGAFSGISLALFLIAPRAKKLKDAMREMELHENDSGIKTNL
jgi:hypothetical protein